MIPITVRKQVPTAITNKLVGAKSSPLPAWSTGASILSFSPDFTCLASVFKSPK